MGVEPVGRDFAGAHRRDDGVEILARRVAAGVEASAPCGGTPGRRRRSGPSPRRPAHRCRRSRRSRSSSPSRLALPVASNTTSKFSPLVSRRDPLAGLIVGKDRRARMPVMRAREVEDRRDAVHQRHLGAGDAARRARRRCRSGPCRRQARGRPAAAASGARHARRSPGTRPSPPGRARGPSAG